MIGSNDNDIYERSCSPDSIGRYLVYTRGYGAARGNPDHLILLMAREPLPRALVQASVPLQYFNLTG